MDNPLLLDPSGVASQHAQSAELHGFTGRELVNFADFQAANALYARVFAYEAPEFTLNPNLLSALSKNGGSVVGVFGPDGALVGFAYGFAGRDLVGGSYHYSQSAVVAPGFQGRGIGKFLKKLQRDVAERFGYESMRWTFDPILTRNAHFNFSTLGAIGVAFQHDYYARPGTDRLLVDWAIHPEVDPYQARRSVKDPSLGSKSWGKVEEQADTLWLPLPIDTQQTIELGLQAQISDALESVLESDMVLIDCRRVGNDTAAYLAVPRYEGEFGASLTFISNKGEK